MYLYNPPASEEHRGTVVSLGELSLTLKRRTIDKSTIVPYRWICALDIQFPSQPNDRSLIQATGFLISPRHVLTAARNLVRYYYPKLTWESKKPTRVDAMKVTITPALDGTPGFLKKRAPGGSIDLRPSDWWIPDQYFSEGIGLTWDAAVLTLPKELPSIDGVHWGYWSDAFLSPRTKIEAATPASLLGLTLTTCGYPDGECIEELPLPTATNLAPQPSGPVTVDKRSAAKQWETFGRVQTLIAKMPEGMIAYDAAGCRGMSGAPVWQNTGTLRVVGMHMKSDVPDHFESALPPEFGIAMAFQPELLVALRQRIALAGLRASF